MLDEYHNMPLSKYSFTKTGGNAETLVFPKTTSDIQDAVSCSYEYEEPLTLLGNASNVIINDTGLKGLVAITQKMNKISVSGTKIVADAGASMIDVSNIAQKHGLTGMEYCAGLPGTVGGAEFMNASAYNGSTGKVTKKVEVVTRPYGKIKVLNHQQMCFGYRHSILQNYNGKMLVTKAIFQLKRGNKNKIQALMDDFNAQRMAKQPLNYPSCGSVFRRPKGHYVGQLIHDAHLQGYQYGGARVSRVHAGFIVNVNHATATDYLHVIHHVQHVIYQKNKIKLYTEVRILSNNEKQS